MLFRSTATPSVTRRERKRAHEEQNAQSPSKITNSVGVATTRTLPSRWVSWRAVLRIFSTPRMIALHLVTVVLVATMLSLSNWQWHRHVERREFNDQVRARAAEVVRPLEDIISEHPDPEDAQWFTVSAQGTFLSPTFQLVNVSQNGAAGYDVVTPLALDDGRIVIVNRGFLPLSAPLPEDVAGTEATIEIGRAHV